MKKYHVKTIQTLNKLKIRYFIGSDSLVGLSEGDIYEYTHNLKLYIFPLSLLQKFYLFYLLLVNKIIFKPKNIFGHLFFKLRYKPTLFTKDSSYVKLSIFEKLDKNKLGIFIGNKITTFDRADLEIFNYELNNINISIPKNHLKFIQKYKNELLSNFYKKHTMEFDSKSEQNAIEFLYKINDVLKNSNLTYWIEGGTLLGAIRDKKLIPWDHDLDMGIINNSNEDIEKIIKRLKNKFYVSVKNFNGEGTWELGKYRVLKVYPKKWIFFKHKLCCDLFIYYLGIHNGEEVYKYVVWGKNAFHKKEFFETIGSLEFYNKKINIPNKPKAFLEVKYGKDWNIPQEKWNVALDDGSIVRS